ncbi:GNAT family N-acetyltransferase [Micromonospora polyrhachis]|uniref:RimJ/RimL family protein N-acetyltransferase n=1 Tax=Micromonospora polyrhachis TaxID=1282883 RepID=A0A7W7WRR1_9ACTN|nr:GNAT family protein [Micromonospora polyrhachis]MBB4961370.1 RimJ/RimL family protein N-acetyltransferase [Micromonospora polyrhachis]
MNVEVSLRPVREDDLTFLNDLSNDPAASGTYQWNGWHDPHVYRRRWAENGLLADDRGLLIVSAGADRVGLVSWRKILTPGESYCWNIGALLAPETRGRGYGTRAQRLLAEYLLAHTRVNRVEASTEIGNVAEQRALEKAGFTREGVLRGFGFRDGAWRDGVLYSLLRADLSETPSDER